MMLVEIDPKEVLQRIRTLMKERGFTDNSLGVALGDRDRIRNLKRGKASLPGAENLASMAKILNTTTDYILFGGDPMPPKATLSAEEASDLAGRILKACEAEGIDLDSATLKEALRYFYDAATTRTLTEEDQKIVNSNRYIADIVRKFKEDMKF